MNEATKKTLSQVKELTDSEQHDARQKFARMREVSKKKVRAVCRIYSMQTCSLCKIIVHRFT